MVRFVPFLVEQDWQAAGHAHPGRWLELLGDAGVLLIAALYLYLIARALLHRARYRANGVLTEAELAQVHAELAAVEKKTVGEVLPVVLERSDAHHGASWLAGLSFLLAGSVLGAGWLPWDRPWLVLLVQLGFVAIGYATARLLPGFLRLFVSEARAEEMAEEQAFQEFHRHELHATEGKTGVLLFVSLLERRAIVLADAGIDARVDEDQWKRTNEALLAGVARGSLKDGLIEGIRSTGNVLELHFPWTQGDRNEVPDRVIVRRE